MSQFTNLPIYRSTNLPTCQPTIKLGANGSEHLQALIAAGQVQVDYAKVGAFLGRERVAHLRARYPLILHGSELILSEPALDEAALAGALDYVALTGTPWYSVHLGFAVENVTTGDGFDPAGGTGPLTPAVAQDRISRNARALRAALPVPLLLENVPRFPNLAHDHVCEPDFIARVVQTADTGFLLDLAHARVSAAYLGYEVYDYLGRLPLERTIEIHLSGPRWGREYRPTLAAVRPDLAAQLVDDVLYDVHEPLREADYELVAWALRETPARAITLEYWQDREALGEQLVRLRAIVNAVASGASR